MNRMESDAEPLREAFSSSIEIVDEGRDCPGTEAIWSSARGETPPREDDGILMHIGECPACAAEWRVARDMADESSPGEVRMGSRPDRRPWWLPMAAAAAAGFVLIAVGLFLWTGRDDTAPVYRARGGEWLQSQIPAEEVLPRERCLLRWTPGPEGTTYQLRVTDERLHVLARGRGLEEAEYLVPEDALRNLPSGSKIVWHVTARLPDGTVVDSASFISPVE